MNLYRLCMIVFLGALTATGCLSTDLYLPALPEVQAEFGISTSAAQLSLTMVMLGMAAGQLVGGPLSDKMGRKKPLVAGMALFALSSWACGMSTSIGMLVFMRFIEGFSGSVGIVIARAVCRDISSGAGLLRLFSILMIINGIAPVLAPVIGGWLLRFMDWHGTFYVLTGIGLLLTLGTFLYRETLPQEKRITSVKLAFFSFPQLLKSSYFLGQCLISGFVFVSFYTYLAGSSFIFQGIYGLTPQEYSYIMAVNGTGLFLTGLIPAWLSHTVREETLLKWSLLIPLAFSIFLCAAFAVKASLWIVLPLLFITVVPLSVTETTSFAMALSRVGKNAGAASALIGFFTVALGGAAMPLAGIGGAETAVPVGVVMVLGYAVCTLVFYRMICHR